MEDFDEITIHLDYSNNMAQIKAKLNEDFTQDTSNSKKQNYNYFT